MLAAVELVAQLRKSLRLLAEERTILQMKWKRPEGLLDVCAVLAVVASSAYIEAPWDDKRISD